ncbi:glycosyltransferase family 4 protein [Rhodanobacter sp. DHB23]|uniref:glycosyltransferase family 4 protein n=1 Tax=Rhodanobacter sp. DHB23 TaxID=2775923 RepID=UPI00177B22DD|nr:glycosyltransferase family 4 protein [Rhodanobacter sp. DHB23]MBD8872191.1 glycosyltransferase family 4 protein [Rhodanobacter sp. DHB23]
MKFLFAATSHEYGGAEVHFITLTQALAAAGHTVEAVVRPDTPIARALAGSAVRLHPGRFRNVLDLRGYRATIAAARRLRPDWLIADFGKEYWPLILVGRLLGIPVALFRHRFKPMNPVSGRLVARCAQRFFAVSESAYRDYVEHGMPADRVQVLFNPVDLALCRPDPAQRPALLQQLGMDESAIVLGCFGRMHGGKGIFTLLEAANAAMAQEPRLHCLWLGDGAEAQILRERIAASPFAARHRQLGWIADVHPYYSVLSMLAFPSTIPEVFGRSSVEAQACSVPVLTSDIGGIPETLHPGVTGLALPAGDVPAWRDAILALCDDAIRLPMAAAARGFVEQRFGATMVAAEFVRLLGEARR